jgi:anti-sigma factor RsiW
MPKQTVSSDGTVTMTCRDLIRRLGDYVDGDLPTKRRTECTEHLVECPDCAAYFESYRATIQVTKHAFRNPESKPVEQISHLVDRILRRQLPFQGI